MLLFITNNIIIIIINCIIVYTKLVNELNELYILLFIEHTQYILVFENLKKEKLM